MSNASSIRRYRQLKRRIGGRNRNTWTIVGVVATQHDVFIHRRRLLPLVIKREQLDYDGQMEERLFAEGFIKQGEFPVWFNPKARLSDVARMCNMKVVGAPVLQFKGIFLTPKAA